MLRVHFLNVGHGDCTVIKHPSGRITMIDVNASRSFDSESMREFVAEQRARRHQAALGALADIGIRQPPMGMLEYAMYAEAAADELTDPIQFMQDFYPEQRIWRFVLTHPDLDHMRGLKRLYDEIGFTNFWDTKHTKPAPSHKGQADQEDWNLYEELRIAKRTRYYLRHDQRFAFALDEHGNTGGDGIEILSPAISTIDACNAAMKSNDLSYVLRVTHAGRSIILPGDAEKPAWDEMRELFGPKLRADFLKASHHGRDTGFDLQAVQTIAPSTVFVSVGRKPETDAHAKYKGQGADVLSTRYYGNIELRIHDDGRYDIFVDRNATP